MDKSFVILTHFMLLVFCYAPWKHQKTRGFLMVSGGTERDHEMGQKVTINLLLSIEHGSVRHNLKQKYIFH